MTKATIYYTSKGKKQRIQYDNVCGIQAGPARDILGLADAAGNDIPLNAPLIMLRLADGNTATFDADNVVVLL